jgi:O-antigen biosynthesis protein WbqP
LTGEPLMKSTPYTAFFKPLLDRAAALLLFLPLCPVLAVLALLVKLTSKGPVFFKQRRVGRYKNEFLILKFRTMYTSAPADMPTHMLKDATSHITPLGKFLRKSSLDELPQLFNILSGEMSFVGPRPALWNQYDLVAERDKYRAHDAVPGITGWAQVTGRDELPIPVKAEKDGYYASHACLALDIRIIFKTFFNVLAAKGVVEGSAGEERK